MVDSDEKVRALVAARIQERGANMREISLSLGKNPTYLQQYLTKKSPRWLPEDVRPALAAALGMTEAQLRRPSATGSQPVNQLTKLSWPVPTDRLTHQGRAQIDGSQETLKVLGMAEGGPDGWSLWNGDVIETIRRPDNLIGVEGAYAVYVIGHSMEPRYNQGEHVHIHPHKPLEPGCYVLVQRRPVDGSETPLAVVKRLVRRSGSKIVLEQLNPEKQFDVKVEDIVSIHRIVGSSEA